MNPGGPIRIPGVPVRFPGVPVKIPDGPRRSQVVYQVDGGSKFLQVREP